MPHRILIQAGHNSPREPGFEGGTGTIREQELTKAMQQRLLALFKADKRFKPVCCFGDIPDGVKVDAALYLHGDGSNDKTATGYSFGFPKHPVNAKLARLIGEEFEKLPGHPPHHTDNYTGGLREYYGYRRVDTRGPEVLVEHGFLTNPREQKWMFKNLARMANAEYRAVCRYFGLKPQPLEVKDMAPIGFRMVGPRVNGKAKTVRRSLEPARVVARAKGAVVRPKERRPLQPAGAVEKEKDEIVDGVAAPS